MSMLAKLNLRIWSVINKTGSKLRTSQRPSNRKLAFLAVGVGLGWVVLRWAPRQFVPLIMYIQRDYNEPHYHLKSLVNALVQKPDASYKAWEVESEEAGGKSSKISWNLSLFPYRDDGNTIQRGFLLLPEGSSDSHVTQFYVVHGGNAMLGLDWLDLFQMFTKNVDARAVENMVLENANNPKQARLNAEGLESIHEFVKRNVYGFQPLEGRHASDQVFNVDKPEHGRDAERLALTGSVDADQLAKTFSDPAVLKTLNEIFEKNKETTGFLLLDYPGYGLNSEPGSGKEPTSYSIRSNLGGAIKTLRERYRSGNVGPARDLKFSALGHSIGCAALLNFQRHQLEELETVGSVGLEEFKRYTNVDSSTLLYNQPVIFERMILSAPFSSIRDIAQTWVNGAPGLLLDFMIPFEHSWRNDENVGAIYDFFGKEERAARLMLSYEQKVKYLKTVESGSLESVESETSDTGTTTRPDNLVLPIGTPRMTFIHGTRDGICHHWMSVRLAKIVGSTEIQLPGLVQHISWLKVGHNDILDRASVLYATLLFGEA